jgi:tetratricopeptide (TPR) repeat protein
MKAPQPLDPQELLHIFLAHLKAGRKQEANRLLAQALLEDPSKASAYSLLIGGLLAQNGQYEEAVPLYQEAMRLKPEEPAAYFYLGVAYHALKREPESEQIWDELATRFPGSALDHYQKALRLLKRKGN